MVLFYTNSHFQYISVPFERISLINFFSLVLPGGGALELFRTWSFAPGAGVLQPVLPGVGISPPQKIPQESAVGVLTTGIDIMIHNEHESYAFCGISYETSNRKNLNLCSV